MDLKKQPHRRWNPLKQEWIVVSPQRTQRPWQGQIEKPSETPTLSFDPSCYLCPGNVRAGGKITPQYETTYVFENDYAALVPDVAAERIDEDGLLIAEGESGICRVLCFSPRHDLTLAKMTVEQISHVVNTWADQITELGAREDINYVQIFENRGAMMGASNPHPHGQIWGSRSLPNEIVFEIAGQRAYFARTGSRLLERYLQTELAKRERIVLENEHFAAIVPYWAVWPFELIVLPKFAVRDLAGMNAAQRLGFAEILQAITSTYDAVFDTPFPYSMGLHGAPSDGDPHEEWVFHAHFYPPLLRSATIRKFMVGFELLGSPQRDITPEVAAEILRSAAGRR